MWIEHHMAFLSIQTKCLGQDLCFVSLVLHTIHCHYCHCATLIIRRPHFTCADSFSLAVSFRKYFYLFFHWYLGIYVPYTATHWLENKSLQYISFSWLCYISIFQTKCYCHIFSAFTTQTTDNPIRPSNIIHFLPC